MCWFSRKWRKPRSLPILKLSSTWTHEQFHTGSQSVSHSQASWLAACGWVSIEDNRAEWDVNLYKLKKRLVLAPPSFIPSRRLWNVIACGLDCYREISGNQYFHHHLSLGNNPSSKNCLDALRCKEDKKVEINNWFPWSKISFLIKHETGSSDALVSIKRPLFSFELFGFSL